MTRVAALLAAGTALALSLPASAQDHSMHDMPGMAKPKQPKRKPQAAKPAPAKPKPVPPKPAAEDHSGHMMPGTDMGAPTTAEDKPAPTESGAAADPHAMHSGMEMGQDAGAMPETGTALPAGDAPAPPVPTDYYGDRFFPADEMARTRHAGMKEMGGQSFGTAMFNLAEVQVRDGREGFRWDGEGWFGGDINRLTVKSEGEGRFGEGVEGAEVQALYSRAIDPYWNLQVGVRHDFKPTPNRTYATLGFEGLAPYQFEIEGAVFLSPQGDVLGRLEGYYDQRITQRLILQPRLEVNLSAQDMPSQRIGSGLTDVELGLRARYEITRRLAPYVGLNWEAKSGRTADYARADGEKPASLGFVAGIRFGF
ncbi:copper resistance protein B [Sphingomonas kyeonggiensis]|uniref:Copper resistance protein B n=1 Tax=Sphingomonas kyeonggiensis TaxID=1268553 RepID=A0A7W6NZ99_9SPHN|nr:copper resistance protein B [Sphingomonas kyeonggiensis]MBB4100434.1 copper resistance protein B [Sphingomonas kyeonggiensis]